MIEIVKGKYQEHDLRNRLEWMTDDQFECYHMVACVVGGYHLVGAEPKEFGRGISISMMSQRFSTYDFNLLTNLVIACHDRAIRMELHASSPNRIKFVFHRRHKREGGMYERHPTIEQAIMNFRG